MKSSIFKSRSNKVRGNLFKTARRSYRISDIEKVTIKRPLFWFGLPLSIGALLLTTEYSPYLYEIEKQICILMFTVVPVILWNIGTLSLTSKSYRNDDAITGFMPFLKKDRHELENRMFEINKSTINVEEEEEHG